MNLAEGIKCTTPMTVEIEVDRGSGTASGMQQITRAGCLGTGQSAENRLNLHPNTYIQIQKSVILGTCSIVGNFLNYK
jgi:hypothetical protein